MLDLLLACKALVSSSMEWKWSCKGGLVSVVCVCVAECGPECVHVIYTGDGGTQHSLSLTAPTLGLSAALIKVAPTHPFVCSDPKAF